jgi:flotillin
MNVLNTLGSTGASTDPSTWIPLIAGIFSLLLVGLFALVFFLKQYRRCPSNRVLVVYGKVSGQRAAKCLHGGGAFVWPIIQSYAYIGLEPLVIDIPLQGALSLNNIRVNVPSTFTVGVSTDSVLMQNAAERLLMMNEESIREQAQDIILGQLRLVIATLSIEEINKDREKFMALINENVAEEINKIGLELINVNIRDITDESDYIEAIGKRAAAEAINRAKVEVAQQQRDGSIGEAAAVREQDVRVAEEQSKSEQGRKDAERAQRITIAELEAQAITGEVESKRDYEIATAERTAETVAARKRAEQQQRIKVAEAESVAIEGENTSNAQIAESNARLAEIRAQSMQKAEIASAEAQRAILEKEREEEIARLGKEIIAPQEIEKRQIEIAAEAKAEKSRREAAGEADAILARYLAEAEGIQKVLEAKAKGYANLVASCGDQPDLAPTLLLVEMMPDLVKEQVKAISNLQIDKITVWEGGRGEAGGNATSNFLSGLIGSLPPVHELAEQAGIDLPEVLGKVRSNDEPVVVEDIVVLDEPVISDEGHPPSE